MNTSKRIRQPKLIFIVTNNVHKQKNKFFDEDLKNLPKICTLNRKNESISNYVYSNIEDDIF